MWCKSLARNDGSGTAANVAMEITSGMYIRTCAMCNCVFCFDIHVYVCVRRKSLFMCGFTAFINSHVYYAVLSVYETEREEREKEIDR